MNHIHIKVACLSSLYLLAAAQGIAAEASGGADPAKAAVEEAVQTAAQAPAASPPSKDPAGGEGTKAASTSPAGPGAAPTGPTPPSVQPLETAPGPLELLVTSRQVLGIRGVIEGFIRDEFRAGIYYVPEGALAIVINLTGPLGEAILALVDRGDGKPLVNFMAREDIPGGVRALFEDQIQQMRAHMDGDFIQMIRLGGGGGPQTYRQFTRAAIAQAPEAMRAKIESILGTQAPTRDTGDDRFFPLVVVFGARPYLGPLKDQQETKVVMESGAFLAAKLRELKDPMRGVEEAAARAGAQVQALEEKESRLDALQKEFEARAKALEAAAQQTDRKATTESADKLKAEEEKLNKLKAELAALQKQKGGTAAAIKTRTNRIATLKKQIAACQKIIDALKATPPPAEAPGKQELQALKSRLETQQAEVADLKKQPVVQLFVAQQANLEEETSRVGKAVKDRLAAVQEQLKAIEQAGGAK
ncbi:MAG: hypothetical protein LBI20_03605 [Holosporales bacterium]|jgi:hypothetical protein|nr:hypothetical protein [Holosporales bacterium]